MQWERLASLLTACAFMFIANGCPTEQTGGSNNTDTAAVSSTVDEELEDDAASDLTPPISLLAGTSMEGLAPEALEINRDGDRLFLKKHITSGFLTEFASYELTAVGIGERVLEHKSGELYRAFIHAHPTRDECLVASHVQAADGVVDRLWRLTSAGLAAVPFSDAPGFPELPAVALYNLEPFYSWDGSKIVVPLHEGGFVVVNTEDGEARFFSYPALPFAHSGSAISAVYSPGDRQLVSASFWRLELENAEPIDQCAIFLYSLDADEPLRSIELDWPVYQIASPDPENLPWLARGSRYPNKQTEFRRVPRLATLDPDSGKVKLQVFSGRPYWPLVLAPKGDKLAYLDQRRAAIVRLNRDTGAIDIDLRFYSEDAQLSYTMGDEVYVWQASLLFRAEFTEHEKALTLGTE